MASLVECGTALQESVVLLDGSHEPISWNTRVPIPNER